jgi:hypothetical protein
MPNEDADPYAHQPQRFVGRSISFDHQGKRLVGVVEQQVYAGRTLRGSIPDYALSIRGGSGALLTGVSLVESYATFPE